MERANSVEGEKFIIIGGSSSNLGFDSKCFEELAGKPAVNLAVSAGIPLRAYMKAAENCASPGDVILMPLEYGYYASDFYAVNEAYIDVTAVDANLKCKESFWGNADYCFSYFLRSFTRLNDVLLFGLKKVMHTDNTIYIADSVNTYGDFCLHENRASTYKRTVSNTCFTYNQQTLEEINAFISRMEEMGVSVYITYPAFDMQSIQDHETYAQTIQHMMDTNFSAQHILGTPELFSYDENCFYDTAYHLTYENRRIYTQKLFDCYQMTA